MTSRSRLCQTAMSVFLCVALSACGAKAAQPTTPSAPGEVNRIGGERFVVPSVKVRAQMVKRGQTTIRAVVEHCVRLDGELVGATLLESSGYRDWDRALLQAVRRWRFAPLAPGTEEPICKPATFHFRQG